MTPNTKLRRTRRGVAALGTALLWVLCCTPNSSAASADTGVQAASRTEFTQHIVHLEQMVGNCKDAAKGCDSDVGPDDQVNAEGTTPAFVAHWDWLRTALRQARDVKAEDRANAMNQAKAHLDELAQEGTAQPDSLKRREAETQRAQKKVEDILARSEFQGNAGPTWWQRQGARIINWIARGYQHVSDMAQAAPWLGTLFEWLFFVGAAVALLVFVLRTFRRQRLQIAVAPSGTRLSAWDREATDWAREAERWAGQAEWREAVHCLYWAAIVKLESRRAWKHNPARTPREYVRLLQPGSAQQSALRRLTGIFERVWYGLREAELHDYESARSLFEGLSTGTSAPETQA